MRDFEDVFTPQDTTTEQVAEAPPPVHSEVEPEATSSDSDSTGVKQEQSVSPDTSEPSEETRAIPLSALTAERKVRQQREAELEQRLAETQQQLAAERQRSQVQQQPQTQPLELTEEAVWADLPGTLKKVRGETTAELTAWKYAASEQVVRAQFADADEMISEYLKVAQANPAIARSVHDAPMPAVAAYQIGKQARDQRKANDPVERQKLIDDAVAKGIAAEMEKLKGTLAAGSVPTSIVGTRGGGANTPAIPWSGPRKFESVFSRAARR